MGLTDYNGDRGEPVQLGCGKWATACGKMGYYIFLPITRKVGTCFGYKNGEDPQHNMEVCDDDPTDLCTGVSVLRAADVRGGSPSFGQAIHPGQ